MNPGVGLLFNSNPWVLRMQCKECEIDNSYLHFTQFQQKHTQSFTNPQFLKIGLTHKKSPVESPTVATCLFAGKRGEAQGCAFQRRKDARSLHQRLFVKNVGKTEGNRSKMKILSSGVVFTFEEGLSTSHVCLKGQQPIFRIVEIVLP